MEKQEGKEEKEGLGKGKRGVTDTVERVLPVVVVWEGRTSTEDAKEARVGEDMVNTQIQRCMSLRTF